MRIFRVSPAWPLAMSAVALVLFVPSVVALLHFDRGWFRGVLGFVLVFGILFPLTAFAVGSIFGKLTVGDGVVAIRTAYKTRRFERGETTAAASVIRMFGNPLRIETLTLTRTSGAQKAIFFISWMSRRRRDALLAAVAAELETPIVGLDKLRPRA